jgi:hypothetical protein
VRDVNIKRVLILGAGGGALAVWLAAAATSPSRPAPPIAAPKTPSVDASGAELAKEIERLRERIRPSAVPLESRDLFHYASRATRRATVAPIPQIDAQAAPSTPAAAVRPLQLVGLAEDDAESGPVRTAIISGFGQLFIVKEQERVTERYQVTRISSDAVELIDQTDQSSLRLVLK